MNEGYLFLCRSWWYQYCALVFSHCARSHVPERRCYMHSAESRGPCVPSERVCHDPKTKEGEGKMKKVLFIGITACVLSLCIALAGYAQGKPQYGGVLRVLINLTIIE